MAYQDGSCQAVWRDDDFGPCRGVDWSTFFPHFWLPALAYLALIPLVRAANRKLKASYQHTELSTSLLLRYVGTAFEPPRDMRFLSILIALEMIASSADTIMWIRQTYDHDGEEAGGGQKVADVLTMLLFAATTLICNIQHEFKLTYYLSFFNFLELLNVFEPLFIFLGVIQGTWLSFGYLRILRSLNALELVASSGVIPLSKVQLGGMLVALRAVRCNIKYPHHLHNVTLIAGSLTTVMAGTIFVLEVLGEPDIFRATGTPTRMGDLSFIQMFYWIITTISTVGYGDFAPKTNLSQLLVAVFILLGVAFFSVQTGEMIHLLQAMDAGLGVYEGTPGHIIVVGSGVPTFARVLQNFLREILAISSSPNIVLMHATDKSDAIAKGLKRSWCRGRVSFFRGSAMEKADLERVCAQSASLICIISDTETAEIDREDFDNIMRAASIYRDVPEIPLMLMVLRPASKPKAVHVGLPTTAVYSVNELKCNLLARSCSCPGYATLFINLMRADRELDSLIDNPPVFAMLEPWRQMYIKGTAANITGVVLSAKFEGMTFAEAALSAYKSSGCVLLAAQVMGQVMVFPRDYVIKRNDLVFVISNQKSHVAEIELDENDEPVDFNQKFTFNEKQIPESQSHQNINSFDRLESKQQTRGQAGERAKQVASDTSPVPFRLPGFAIQSKKSDSARRVARVPRSRQVQVQSKAVNTAGSKTQGGQTDDAELHAQMADEMVSRGGHVVILCLQPEQTWQQILACLRHLRASNSAFHWPIVVLLPTFPPANLRIFPEVAFMIGNPKESADIQRVALERSDRVILLCGPPQTSDLRLADAAAVVAASECEQVLCSSSRTQYAVYEFIAPRTVHVLPIVPESWLHEFGHKHFLDLSSGLKEYIDITENLEFILSPRYASGRVFITNLVGQIWGRSSRTAGILQLAECMTAPSHNNTAHLVPIPKKFIGRPYGELFEDALTTGLGIETQPTETCLPLGLYRNALDIIPDLRTTRFDEDLRLLAPTGENGDGMSFVLTKPDPDEVLLPNDQVYVYASQTWGVQAFKQMATPATTMKSDPIWEITGKSGEELDELIHFLFRQVDTDHSMKIDDQDEFIELTSWLVRELNLSFTDEGALSALLNSQHFHKGWGGWSVNQYAKWVRLEIIGRCKKLAADPKCVTHKEETEAETDAANKPLQATAGGDITGVPFGTCFSEAEIDDIISHIFDRYDLDESGRIDGPTEAQQLVMNLIYKFGLELSSSEVSLLCDKMDVANDHNWDVARVKKWVKEEWGIILPKLQHLKG